jgi:hypothetical protein
VGLRMRSKLEHMLFRSIWETYSCMHFQSRYDRLKPVQSVWYTVQNPKTSNNTQQQTGHSKEEYKKKRILVVYHF